MTEKDIKYLVLTIAKTLVNFFLPFVSTVIENFVKL